MTWAELEQQTSQQLSQVMVSAHSTIIEGTRVTVLEAFDFLLGAAPTLGTGKPLAGYDMLGDHARARALDLALRRADAHAH